MNIIVIRKEMNTAGFARLCVRSSVRMLGIAAASYATYVAIAWYRFGRPSIPSPEAVDSVMDRFIPVYDVVERHHVRVAAPAEVTYVAACEMDLQRSPAIRALFKSRELLLCSRPDRVTRPRAVVPLVLNLGWGILAEVPGREIVFGAVTQPWLPNVTFRSMPPQEFVRFRGPGYAKIVWSLRADPVGPVQSIFRTETRVCTTDPTAWVHFRRYWSVLSAGILAIRWLSLREVKTDAEQRALAVQR